MKHNKIAIAALFTGALLMTGCATQSRDIGKEAGIKQDQKYTLEVKEKDGSKTKMKCIRKKRVGSHFVEKTCYPAEDYDKIVEKNQEGVRRMKRVDNRNTERRGGL